MGPIDATKTLILLQLLRIHSLEYEWRTKLLPGIAMQTDDLAKLWVGRPKNKPLHPRPKVYQFDSSRLYKGVLVSPMLYRPIDWRGIL